jgi:hypothetical protein
MQPCWHVPPWPPPVSVPSEPDSVPASPVESTPLVAEPVSTLVSELVASVVLAVVVAPLVVEVVVMVTPPVVLDVVDPEPSDEPLSPVPPSGSPLQASRHNEQTKPMRFMRRTSDRDVGRKSCATRDRADVRARGGACE